MKYMTTKDFEKLISEVGNLEITAKDALEMIFGVTNYAVRNDGVDILQLDLVIEE